jgi:hypothetical protein
LKGREIDRRDKGESKKKREGRKGTERPKKHAQLETPAAESGKEFRE